MMLSTLKGKAGKKVSVDSGKGIVQIEDKREIKSSRNEQLRRER